MVLFENFLAFEVFTDSAFALHCVNLCQTCESIEDIALHDDFDLLRRIFLCRSPSKRVTKIKAHQSIHAIPDLLQRYRAIGNQVADAAATTACEKHLPEVVAQLQAFHADLCNQKNLVMQYYLMNLDLQAARARVTETNADEQTVGMVVDIQSLLCEWNVCNVWIPDQDLGCDELIFLAGGSNGHLIF